MKITFGRGLYYLGDPLELDCRGFRKEWAKYNNAMGDFSPLGVMLDLDLYEERFTDETGFQYYTENGFFGMVCINDKRIRAEIHMMTRMGRIFFVQDKAVFNYENDTVTVCIDNQETYRIDIRHQ